MRDIHLNCMMVAKEIPLDLIALQLGSTFSKKWNEVLVIEGDQLEQVLKYQGREYQKVLIYSYGAVTFINCAIDEMRIIIDFIHSITEEVEESNLLQTIEVHRIWLLETGGCKLFLTDDRIYSVTSEVFMIASHVIAQSVATGVIEKEIIALLEQSEGIINRIEKFRFFSNRKRGKMTASVIRFQQGFIRSAQVFGSPLFTNNNLEIREMYHRLSEYYELQDRFETIYHKIQELKRITERYSNMVHFRLEHRLLLLEVFLLALFPFKFMIGPQLKEIVSWVIGYLNP